LATDYGIDGQKQDQLKVLGGIRPLVNGTAYESELFARATAMLKAAQNN
jgi:hypothetical protein